MGLTAGTVIAGYEVTHNYWNFGIQVAGVQLNGNRANIIGKGDGFMFGAYSHDETARRTHVINLFITKEAGVSFQEYDASQPIENKQ